MLPAEKLTVDLEKSSNPVMRPLRHQTQGQEETEVAGRSFPSAPRTHHKH